MLHWLLWMMKPNTSDLPSGIKGPVTLATRLMHPRAVCKTGMWHLRIHTSSMACPET